MNYPAWEVPGIGGPWVIGIVSIFHVLIAWFAVGGGLFLPMAERKALRENRGDWLPILKKHSRFFLVLTSVFGAVSGVGIWFSIGLVQPEATSTLIHNFVFGWAIEWVFFMIELAAAAVYYYTWGRIPAQLHLKVGFVYAGASFLTLVIINGILSFMLTPGSAWLSVAGTGQESSMFWPAFFNPTYFPSLVIRSLACLALAGVWALYTLSKIDEPELLKTRISMTRWSATWLVPMFLLLPLFLGWFLLATPASNRGLLELGMTTIGSGAFTQVTRISLLTVITTFTIAGVVYFFAYRVPREFSRGHAFAVLFLAVIATSSTEYARETLRKPYVVNDHMYSNSVRKTEREAFNQNGYFTHSMWKPENTADRLALGKQMFRGQCMACHTESGYRSMKRLIGDRDSKAVKSLLQMLHEAKPDSAYTKYMPPLVGSDDEIDALSVYLASLNGKPATSGITASR
jgi:cytochrome bd-type quinol oxidase subunit 1/mono/diheme cytochrome c family protein